MNIKGIVSFIAATTAVLAAPSAVAREGGFMGVHAGWLDAATDINMIVAGDSEARVESVAVDGGAGGAFVGYGWEGMHGFLALEANLGLNAGTSKLSAGNLEGRLESGPTYGLGALMGLNLNGGMATYLRVGWQVGKYELKIRDADPVDGFSASDEKTHDGLRVGVGTLIPLTERTDVRLEWGKTFHSREDYFRDDADRVTIKPRESHFMVGVSTRF